jgi:hypothetical protein
MMDLTLDHVSKRYRVRHTADTSGGRRSLRQPKRREDEPAHEP